MTATDPPCPVCRRHPPERPFTPFCSRACSDADLDGVRHELTERIERLAAELLGEPSLKRRNSWRFGSRGSLEVITGGGKRAAWFSRESGTGGGPIDLIAHAHRCSIAEAISWARDWTGHRTDTTRDFQAEAAERRATRETRAREAAAAEAEDRATRTGTAARIARAAVPIAGTVAEAYLARRGITAPAGGWPAAIAFHPPSCALIVLATLPDGTLHAVQRVFLTADGRKVEGTPEHPTKRTNGVLTGAAVRLPGDPAGPLLVAEGPETAASVWTATGFETWAAIGAVGNIMPPAGRLVVVCRDDDPRHSPADRYLLKTVARWREAGHTVAIATPSPFRRYDKSDHNDVLQAKGAASVRRRIEAAISPGGGPPERLPINVVRKQLRKAVSGFFDEARRWGAATLAAVSEPPDIDPGEMQDMQAADWDALIEGADSPPAADPDGASPPVHAVKVDVGSGKTLAAYHEAIRLLAEMRAAGDVRTGAVAIPTHKLADEQAAIFDLHARETGLVARVWRGMAAPDPDTPGETMCQRLEAVQDARDAMADVYASCCRRKRPDGEYDACPFFSTCGYQRQRNSSADLWIVAHELLFMKKPAAVGKLAFLIVDESAWQDGLDGVHGKPMALSLDALGEPAPLPVGANNFQRENAQRLDFLRGMLLDGLRDLAPGPLTVDALTGGDLALQNTREAYRLEWQNFLDPGLQPGMTKAERREAVLLAAGNTTIPRRAKAWAAITALLEDDGPQQSGWAAIAVHTTENGPQRVLHLKARKPIRSGWQVPTLLIDATLNVDLARPFWPRVQLVAELLADAPHQTIRQVIDRSFGKSAIEPMEPDQPGYTPDEARRRMRGLRNVHAIVNREARRYGGRPVLAVLQKAAKEALPSFGPVAPCIELAHHNAVAGRDEWRNVPALIVVGRTQPAPASVERLAEALTGRAVQPIDGWYERGDAVRQTGAGAVAIEADRHPDPVCEAIRWQVCEGELMQIVGRGRGVNRTEDDPLDVLVLTDAALPMPVAETLQAADLAPSPDDLMLAAAGIAFSNPTDAAAAYPHFWATRNAAKLAFRRHAEKAQDGEVGVYPLIIDTYRGPTPTSAVGYQLQGAGRSRSDAVYLPDVVPDPTARLAVLLGPLAWCSLDSTEPPPNPSAPRTQAPQPVPPADHEPPPDAPDDPGWTPDAEPAAPEWAAASPEPPRKPAQPPKALAAPDPLPSRQPGALPWRWQPAVATGPPW